MQRHLKANLLNAPKPQTRHYHVIDVVRGLAACAILFWHYQHFMALGMAEPGARSDYPLFGLLGIFYEQGGAAVQLFWIISGFVFSAVYVGSGVSASTFFQHRFARLYPLHLVTLLIVAALQVACFKRFGGFLIYPDNTLPNFVLHLLMATGWGLGGLWSFNGPIWSVSAELGIYALFWIVLGTLFRWGVVFPVTAALGFIILAPYSPVASCGGYFFVGCAVYSTHRSLATHWQLLLGVSGIGAFAVLLEIGLQGVGVLLLFAGVTLICAAVERGSAGQWARRIPWVAENTYGVYLWHIPVQLVLLLGMSAFGISREIALRPWFLAIFVGLVVCLARLSFVTIERPARDAIRGYFN